MWEIYEHRRVVKELRQLPIQVRKRYEKWKDIIRISGPKGLGLIKGFHDEALHGERRGERSSRLSNQYRLIYKVVFQEVIVLVVDITAHDYRRR